MTVMDVCCLLRKKIIFVLIVSIVGCLIGIGAGFSLPKGTYSSTTSMYVELSQDIPVISEDGSVVERYREYQSDTSTNMVTDVATLARNQEVITESANALQIHNPGDYTITSTVEKTSHVITLTVSGPNEDVQKLANQLIVTLKEQSSMVLNLDSIRQVGDASDPVFANGTKKRIAYAVIGLFVALIIAILVVVLQDVMKPRVKNNGDIETMFGLPVLGEASSASAVGRLKTVLEECCREKGGTTVGIASISGLKASSVVSKLNDFQDDNDSSFIELPAFMESANSISQAHAVDGVALVIRPYVTFEKDIAMVVEQLRLAKNSILGFILVD